MDSRLFDGFRTLVYRESGIVLEDDKASLLTSRIQGRLIELGIDSAGDYLQIVLGDKSGGELIHLINAISTNTTYFYREPRHYDIYREYLQDLKRKGNREVKIWCAAASTGEEPYCLCFEALEHLDPRIQNVRILGTDISTKALHVAVEGYYPAEAARSIPDQIRLQYMERIISNGDEIWRVKDGPRSKILFKRLNLTRTPFKLQGEFDVIFCRNVMIYFDVKTRSQIVNDMYRLLRPGGIFFIGVTESLLGISHSFTKVDTSVFRK
jgi:chemotaxis protein methyltransferase CheR